MSGELVFEKHWFLFYLFGGFSLGAWFFVVGAAVRIRRVALRDNSQRPPDEGRKYKQEMTLLSLFIVGLGTVLCGSLAFLVVGPYLTRFDRAGVRWLSATGWKSEPWSQVSSVELTSISGHKQPVLRVFLPHSVLEISSGMFAHPEQVAHTLQAEVERHHDAQAVEQTPRALNQARP